MSSRTYRVDSHWLAMGGELKSEAGGAPLSAQAYITCSGEGCRFVLWFLPEGDALPAATCDLEGTEAALYLPFSTWAPFVDLVQTTSPLYAYVSSDEPSQNCLRTSVEAVAGEMM